jgi:hypothetical protein
MLDKYKKLVIVAEAMVAEMHACQECVEGVEVSIELNVGVIRLGRMREYAVYCPEENQYEPSYAIDYTTDRCYDWIENEWMKRVPKIQERHHSVEYNPFEYIDELPF